MEVPRVSHGTRSSSLQERVPFGALRRRKRIILCFDGTGNKFSGTDSDSNILKIYRMLDRNNGDKHYYQVFSECPPCSIVEADPTSLGLALM